MPSWRPTAIGAGVLPLPSSPGTIARTVTPAYLASSCTAAASRGRRAGPPGRRSAGRARLAGDRLDRAVIAREAPAPRMEDPQPPLGAPDRRARDADDGDLPPPVPVVGAEVREPVAGLRVEHRDEI